MTFRRYMVNMAWLVALGVVCHGHDQVIDNPAPSSTTKSASLFLVKPYLQLGNIARENNGRDLVLLWHAEDSEASWVVEYQTVGQAAWSLARPPSSHMIAVSGIAAHRLFRAALVTLAPGKEFGYRVRRNGEIVFKAKAFAPKERNQPFRFVSFGDSGAGTAQQKLIAYQTFLARPDLVMITGDIVYNQGRASEYLDYFWPIYNADRASPLIGAPLLRSTLFVAAPGNHDIGMHDLRQHPDGLAYFLFWDQPRNGPGGVPGGPLVPVLTGPIASREAFINAAGDAYPRMASFSFDYGDAHWTILDSNPYVDWTNAELRAWVEHDLATAHDRPWRFVAFHHPGFNSSQAHFGDQQMRLLADVFEAGHVDVVFSGHVHNYQRTYPLRFTAATDNLGKPVRDRNNVPGQWTLDTVFDGCLHTRPEGVIYLVTGAGGNTLYNPEQQNNPGSWQPFTCKFISRIHTLTVTDVAGTRLTIRQLSTEGAEVDRITVTR